MDTPGPKASFIIAYHIFFCIRYRNIAYIKIKQLFFENKRPRWHNFIAYTVFHSEKGPIINCIRHKVIAYRVIWLPFLKKH